MGVPVPASFQDDRYRAAVAAEQRTYQDCTNINDLPEIFHYWSNKYVRSQLEEFGFSTPNQMFLKYACRQCEQHHAWQFVSLGSGNCELEIELALHLLGKGYSDFVIECLDLNSAMLERGSRAAVAAGVQAQLRFIPADCNTWIAAHEYDAVIANQALHHVLNLEGVFQQVKACLQPDGIFIISDMIGRNGHQCWPEALEIVHEFWRQLPPSHRFNEKLGRYEELYENWDCSGEGFEGIRSQDILPLLLANFGFELFIAFANIVNPFVDRPFGFNFDVNSEWDRAFIDQVHKRDAEEIIAGHLKPTHMLAVVGRSPCAELQFREPLTPEFCIRSGEMQPQNTVPPAGEPYDWLSWPHSAQSELEIACRRLKEAEDRIKDRDRKLEATTAWGLRLNKDFEERTAWALQLDREREERSAYILRLTKDFEDRSAWALELNQELERLAWARTFELRWPRCCALVKQFLSFRNKQARTPAGGSPRHT